jgi:hypothetical protein
MKSALRFMVFCLASSLAGGAYAQGSSSTTERAENKAEQQHAAAKDKCAKIADPEKKKTCRKEAKAQAKIKQHKRASESQSSK